MASWLISVPKFTSSRARCAFEVSRHPCCRSWVRLGFAFELAWVVPRKGFKGDRIDVLKVAGENRFRPSIEPVLDQVSGSGSITSGSLPARI